jgi:hypothetical protein
MPTPPENRVRLQRRVEAMIRIMAPFLNVALAVGDRVSHVLGPRDPDYVPARMEGAGESAPRGLRTRGGKQDSEPRDAR